MYYILNLKLHILEIITHNKFMKKNVIWKILLYFILYSIIGFYLETIFALFTKRTLESRQSFLYGPFCMVYGVGAICLIFCLNKYKNNTSKLFLYGMVVGALVEYFSSYIGELIMHIKWWDYSGAILNIHGRTCLFYAVCWGILSILLIKYINPFLDKLIDNLFQKIPTSLMKATISLIILFIIFDGTISIYALDIFLTRVSINYNINIAGIENTETKNEFLSNLFSDEKMILTYPNMLVVNEKQEIIEIGKVLSNIQNYYYKLGNK